MRDGFYRQTSRVESEHWWFLHRRALVDDLLGGVSDRSRERGERRALDLGCGTGGNLLALARHGGVAVGLDRSALALELASAGRPKVLLVRADANRLAHIFAPGSFDLVTVFNVLYHRWIERDESVLEQIAHVLKPGGRLILTEPAFNFLCRRHDEIDFGARRYTRSGLRRRLEANGFEVTRATYFNCVALLPAAVVALVDRARALAGQGGASDESVELKVPPWPLNRLLLTICSLERRWIARFGSIPFGVGVLLLARRQAGEGSPGQVGT
jgi:SAM-dependent methyltransferase